jgi:pimeloyl-ACP methyl ester carboxylesterase
MIFEKQVVAAYKGMMHRRCDDTETVFYFSADDFPGLHQVAYSFPASAGHTLKGYLYHYDQPTEGRLIVFDHGFGGGHRAYMKEIELLCRHGYRVLSYDHTGCMASGGESPNGLAQSLSDLNDCLTAVKADPALRGLELSVIGHSWGGFSTMNIASLHPDVRHVVVLSGFVSVEEIVNSFFGGILKGYRRAVMALETAANPEFVHYHGVDTLSKTDAKVLLIYSDNDALCKKKHFDLLKEGLSGKENLRFLLVRGKGHNPNYTTDAVGYLAVYVKERTKLLKRKKPLSAEEKKAFLARFDWNRMTAQDETVWTAILQCLED